MDSQRPALPLNIVLVDDDEGDVRNVRRAFDSAGVSSALYIACDGREGLDMLRSGSVPPQRRLVLLDINMPRMSGIEFLRELRRDPALAATVVVILTASNDERDKVEAYQLNVAGYLLKPGTLGGFVDLVQALDHYWRRAEWV